jgi:hypothetical protein
MKIRAKQILVGTTIILFIFSSINLNAQDKNNDSSISSNINKKKDNPITLSSILFGGVLIKNVVNKKVYYFPNAFEWFSANTIEGFAINPKVKFTQNLDNNRFFTLTPSVRYGLGNNRFQADMKIQFFYNPKKNGLISISGGKSFEQIYEESTLSSFNNTLYTFLFQENFLKSYERTYVEIEHSFSPVKDFLFSSNVSWNHRNPLNNLNRFEQNNDYTSNNPANIELSNTAFEVHQAFILQFKLRWQLGHQLVKKRGDLVSQGKYPSITLSYSNALPEVLASDVSYQKISATLEDEYVLGKTKGTWLIEIGDFLTKNELTFVDFNHFKGKQTFYGSYDINQFQLLDYYVNSTSAIYFQVHYEHSFLPLTKSKKNKLIPSIGAHYLYTEIGGHYVELGGGFGKALGAWRVDFYNSLRNGVYESTGFRIGLVFD